MTIYTSTIGPSYNVISFFSANDATPIPFSNNKPPPKMAYLLLYKPILNSNKASDEIHIPIIVAVPYHFPGL